MVQTYGLMIQLNGLILMEMDTVIMERLEPRILISSHTTSPQLMTMIPMVIQIDGLRSTTERML